MAPTTSKKENEEAQLLGDADAIHDLCTEVEKELNVLRAHYEQYFLGLDRRPPNDFHRKLKKKMDLLNRARVRQTAAKFRVQNLRSKYSAYDRIWTRTLNEMENGVYKRDLFKAKLHAQRLAEQQKNEGTSKPQTAPSTAHTTFDELDDVDMGDMDELAEPEIKTAPAPIIPKPEIPKPMALPVAPPAKVPIAAPRPSVSGLSVASAKDLNDVRAKVIYDAYVIAKKRCNEDTTKLSFEAVAQSLRQQIPTLMKQHNAKGVEFKVVIKDGKAVLRAVPKS